MDYRATQTKSTQTYIRILLSRKTLATLHICSPPLSLPMEILSCEIKREVILH